MLQIIRPGEEPVTIPIAENGLNEEFVPIEEMGRLRTWRVQTSPLLKEKYEEIIEVIEQPGFFDITGKLLYPDEEREFYLKSVIEILNINMLRNDMLYSIEFRVKDAEGLAGEPFEITPVYASITFTILDYNLDPAPDVDVEIYNIIQTTVENGTTTFQNFYKLKEWSFVEDDWVYNEDTLDFIVYEKDGFISHTSGSIFVEEEEQEATLAFPKEDTLLDASLDLEYQEVLFDIEFTVYDWNNNILEDVEVTGIDYEGNEISDITDENGKVQLGQFRPDEDYTFAFEYNEEITKTGFNISTEEAEEFNFEVHEQDIKLIQNSSYREKEESSEIAADFNLEYEEMLIDINFIVSDWNNSLTENVKIYYTNHNDEYFEETTDSNGEAILTGFRADEEYTVFFEYNNDETITKQIVAEQEAVDNNWEPVDRAVTLLENGSYREKEEKPEVNADFTDITYQSGLFVDFTDPDELDNWVERYNDDYQMWKVENDQLAHEATQNFRRFLHYLDFWDLRLDEQFGHRILEDMSVGAKVKTDLEDGNQNRLYVRAGMHIPDFDDVEDKCEIVADFESRLQMVYDLEFHITDKDTEEALDGATVKIFLSFDREEEETSDENGIATFVDEDSGDSVIEYEVTRGGYYAETGEVEINRLQDKTIEEVEMEEI